jgi:hypothetical protein
VTKVTFLRDQDTWTYGYSAHYENFRYSFLPNSACCACGFLDSQYSRTAVRALPIPVEVQPPYRAFRNTGVDTTTQGVLSSSNKTVGSRLPKHGKALLRLWTSGIVLILVISLSATVVTRFLFQSDSNPATAVHSYPTHAMRQHMAADALAFERPASAIADTLVLVEARRAPAVLRRVSSDELLDSLYNRPPPSFSL